MPVDKFGKTDVGTSQRVVSGGVTLSQVNNTFLRRDGENTATGNIDMNSQKIINVLDPDNAQDVATRNYVDNKVSLPFKKFSAPYATDLNAYTWKDYQAIPSLFSEREFDELPAGMFACFTGYLPPTRLGILPANTKGYLITLTYQQPVDRNKYYKWINSSNGKEWEAYFKQGAWKTWIKSNKVSKAGDTMTGDLALTTTVDPNTTRNLGCKTISNGQVFNLWLGTPNASLRYSDFLKYLVLSVDGGFQIQNSTSILFTIGVKQNPIGTATFNVPIDMNNKSIARVAEPTNAQDVANKNYVDNLTKRCYSGYIPVLEANASRLGFIASANSNIRGYAPYGAFNNFNVDGINGSWISNFLPCWLQIQCPEPVKIWRVALKARAITGRNITGWNISGSNDGTTFTTLLTSTTALLGASTTPSFFNISTTTAYQYYRLNITSVVSNPDWGMQVMQLYALTN